MSAAPAVASLRSPTTVSPITFSPIPKPDISPGGRWERRDKIAQNESHSRSTTLANPTLRALTGMDTNPASISESALVLIDCQQTYREGVMRLENVEAALKEAAALLQRFRKAGRPVIHIVHDAGSGSPYDVNAPIGQIADVVAPVADCLLALNLPASRSQHSVDVVAGFLLGGSVRQVHLWQVVARREDGLKGRSRPLARAHDSTTDRWPREYDKSFRDPVCHKLATS